MARRYFLTKGLRSDIRELSKKHDCRTGEMIIEAFINDAIEDVKSVFDISSEKLEKFIIIWTYLVLREMKDYDIEGQYKCERPYSYSLGKDMTSEALGRALLFTGITDSDIKPDEQSFSKVSRIFLNRDLKRKVNILYFNFLEEYSGLSNSLHKPFSK